MCDVVRAVGIPIARMKRVQHEGRGERGNGQGSAANLETDEGFGHVRFGLRYQQRPPIGEKYDRTNDQCAIPG
jgi:hypothetical protein